MSVRSDERGENLLEVYVKASELLAYSIRAVCNENHFKARYRYENGAPIVDLARQIMHNVAFAEKIVPFDAASRRLRFNYQSEAVRFAEALKAEITMNVLHFGLNLRKAQHWGDLIEAWRNCCLAWIRSDNRQFGKVADP